VLHVVGLVVVAQLSVVPEPHDPVIGLGVSSAVAMQGPIGAKVSKDLPSQLPAFHLRRPSLRADTSIRQV
jgi:hypothetical protein